jgi:hypothetical protein
VEHDDNGRKGQRAGDDPSSIEWMCQAPRLARIVDDGKMAQQRWKARSLRVEAAAVLIAGAPN